MAALAHPFRTPQDRAGRPGRRAARRGGPGSLAMATLGAGSLLLPLQGRPVLPDLGGLHGGSRGEVKGHAGAGGQPVPGPPGA